LRICQISSRSVYFVALCWRNTQIFAVFWSWAFSGVANCQQPEKVEHGAQLQTFPYPTASKSYLSSNAFKTMSGAQSLTFKSVTNKHKQTNIRAGWFLRPDCAPRSEYPQFGMPVERRAQFRVLNVRRFRISERVPFRIYEHAQCRVFTARRIASCVRLSVRHTPVLCQNDGT